jgi:hypothetical protein
MRIRKAKFSIIFKVPKTAKIHIKNAIDTNKWCQKLHKTYFCPKKNPSLKI